IYRISMPAEHFADNLKAKSTGKKFSRCRPRSQAWKCSALTIQLKMLQSLTDKRFRLYAGMRNVPDGGRLYMPCLQWLSRIAEFNFIKWAQLVAIKPDRGPLT